MAHSSVHLTPLKQPAGSRLCGQCVLAMILGITLAEAIKLIGHRHGTAPKQLRKALQSKGVQCGSTQMTRYYPIPAYAILCLSMPRCKGGQDGKIAHWMLQWDGRIYDPAPTHPWPALSLRGWRITSFIEFN